MLLIPYAAMFVALAIAIFCPPLAPAALMVAGLFAGYELRGDE